MMIRVGETATEGETTPRFVSHEPGQEQLFSGTRIRAEVRVGETATEGEGIPVRETRTRAIRTRATQTGGAVYLVLHIICSQFLSFVKREAMPVLPMLLRISILRPAVPQQTSKHLRQKASWLKMRTAF